MTAGSSSQRGAGRGWLCGGVVGGEVGDPALPTQEHPPLCATLRKHPNPAKVERLKVDLVFHIFHLVVEGLAIVTCIAFLIRQHRVKRGMREYAKANNFEWLGKKLPEGFVLRKSGLRNLEITDVVKGTLHGTDMVIFTASFADKEGHRVSERCQTVVAFPNVHRIVSRHLPPTGDSNLFLEFAGDWIVLYYFSVVVGKDKLGGWCEKMYAVTQKVVADVRAKGQQRSA
jgi:hypothetical protein